VPKKEVIATEQAPAAIGPYSQAIRIQDLVFTAGQIAIDPDTGKLISGDVKAQTRQALKNLSAILEAAGSSVDHVLKTTVFLTDIRTYSDVNAVYAEFFTRDCPARSAIQVAALPLGASVEIEAIAARRS
jgi:2-iminobutanoate/2-iminopropanoate deaminase